jgi:H2-forming N5,N10-methylenetetrahydromethanopterin dehydrogenase-like enzyme
MADEATRAAESMVEQQVREAYQTVTHILNEQPISTVLEAFWDILLAKPHRYSLFSLSLTIVSL